MSLGAPRTAPPRRARAGAPGPHATDAHDEVNNERPPHHQSSEDRDRRVGADQPSGLVPPDDRLTAIIPSVSDDRSPRHADPIDEVKAALDSPPSTAPPRDPLDQVKAALDSASPRPGHERLSGAHDARRRAAAPAGPGRAGPRPNPGPKPSWSQQRSTAMDTAFAVSERGGDDPCCRSSLSRWRTSLSTFLARRYPDQSGLHDSGQ